MARLFRFAEDGYVHATRAKGTPKEAEYPDAVSRIPLKKLVKDYLCCGNRSDCVTGVCEQIDSCRYGKRYLELTREKNDEE